LGLILSGEKKIGKRKTSEIIASHLRWLLISCSLPDLKARPEKNTADKKKIGANFVSAFDVELARSIH
jgi:hypothetical protein